MKKIVLFSALLLTISFAFAQVKAPDKSEFIINSDAASVPGTLVGPATFNGVYWSGPVDLTCNGASANLMAPNYFYSVHEIYSPVGENLVATLVSGFDPMLILYCNPFNPATPLSNTRFGDDDDGGSLNSAFLPGDNVYLAPNTSYFLVVTDFWGGGSGPYNLSVGGNVVFGSPPPPPPVPLSNWALYLGIFLIVIFTAIRFRRMV